MSDYEFSKDISDQHVEMQKKYISGKGAARLAESTQRVEALAEFTEHLPKKNGLTKPAVTAWGQGIGAAHGSSSSVQAALFNPQCFWQNSIFNVAVPDRESAQQADVPPGTLNPDEFNTKTSLAVSAHPFSIGDSTDWEGLIALGAGVGRLQSVVYPADNVNPSGEYTETGGVLLGSFDVDVSGATPSRPSIISAANFPRERFGNVRVTVSAGWKIGYGLPWDFSPSLLLPWDGSGSKYVGTTASLVMTLIDPDNRQNSAVVEKIVLFRWAASKHSETSDDLGQSVFLHNHNTSTPETIVSSLEISGTKLSVNVGAHMTVWRAVAPGDNTNGLFAGAQFGQKMPNGLPENKWVWTSAIGSKIGPIRIFPICYSARAVPQVVAGQS